jgi:predicted MFS family arabinose efflux permease
MITPTDIVVSVPPVPTGRQTWSAVASIALYVALLIASGFMPIRLLTPIAADFHAIEGMAGQAAQYRQARVAAGCVMLFLHAFEDLGGHGVL